MQHLSILSQSVIGGFHDKFHVLYVGKAMKMSPVRFCGTRCQKSYLEFGEIASDVVDKELVVDQQKTP